MHEIDRRAALAGADLLNDLGRPDEALATLRPALEAHPEDAQVLALAALCHLDEGGDAVEALTLARRAVRAAPTLDLPHRLCALAYLRLNQGAPARAEAQRAVDLAPDAWAGYFVLGTAQLGDVRTRRAALDAARRCVDLAPERWETHQLLARAYLDGGRDPSGAEVEAAIAALRRALQLAPDSDELRHDLARAQFHGGRAGRAVGGFSRATLWGVRPHEAVRAISLVLVLVVRYAALALALTLLVLWVLVPGSPRDWTVPGLAPGGWRDLGIIGGGQGAPEWAALVGLGTAVAATLGTWRLASAPRAGARGLASTVARSRPWAAGAAVVLLAACAAQLGAVLLPAPGGRWALVASAGLLALAVGALAADRRRRVRRARRIPERAGAGGLGG